MPRRPNPAVRESLLQAGEDLFHVRGFHGTGVKEITDRAGVPKGSFYSYFPSKDALVVAVVRAYWESTEARHGGLLEAPGRTAPERIGDFFRALMDDHELREFTVGCLLGSMSLELADVSPEARAALVDLFTRWQALLEGTLVAGQDAGEVRRDRSAADMAAALIEGWEGAAMRGTVERSRAPYERFATIVVPSLIA